MVNNTPSRRTVVAGAVAGGVALPVLAACGSSGSSADDAVATPAGPGQSNGSGAGSGAAKPLAATSAIPVGGGKVFADAKVVVTQPTEGDFKAFSAVCTHQGCLVTTISDGEIHCPCHGSTYSVADGEVLVGPATQPLPAESITVKNGEISLA